MQEKGTISVHSENIFPIIKKFLYSDHEVFLRELVSNAVDATQKLKQLSAMGEYDGQVGDLRVQVTINDKLKTITISDQGLGMTAGEIKKYINQVAFSGATAFVEKYKDKVQQHQLIGCFGLGFYSAFMVADRVDIITKSYQSGAEAVHWTCDGSTTFEINKAVKKAIGTDVILYLSQDAEEFLQKSRIQELLHKYCKFLPVPIEFDGKVINNTQPIWTKSPQELQDKDYLDFYQELYPHSPAPLFWIHLNVDYPFNLTGVLYFPATTHRLEHHPNRIQLYAKQVFITDEVKDIVPPFLMLLHGVIDSPDIPLNVSRSSLQADSNVKKINAYITKKVADKLEELFKKDRKAYEDKWPHIDLFVKYGMLTEEKFYEKAKDFILLKTVDQEYFTIDAYREKVKLLQADNQQNIILLYATNPLKQDLYIQACKQQGYSILLLDGQLDSHLIGTLEHKLEHLRFKSVDAEPIEQLINQGKERQASVLTNEEQEQLKAIYKKAIPDDSVAWSAVPMSADELPVVITVPELMRRLQAMAQLQPHAGETSPMGLQAAINVNHPLSKKILSFSKKENKQIELATRAYQLGLLAQNMLSGAELTQFIKRMAVELS
jgi:molecular chaperone HtpG